LAQPFVCEGQLTGVNIDLRFKPERDPFQRAGLDAISGLNADSRVTAPGRPLCRVRLLDHAGSVLTELAVDDDAFFQRFSVLLALPAPLAAGRFAVELTARQEVGWSRGLVAEPCDPEIAPLSLVRPYLRDGQAQTGVLALGAQVRPAPNPEFSKVFDLDEAPAAARLHATGLGYATWWINGHRVGDGALEPAPTQYDKRVDVSVFDVAELLRAGSNEIIARTGRGFWGAHGSDVWGWSLAPWTAEPMVWAHLEVGGQRGGAVIGTDGSWLTRASDITSEMLYTGVVQEVGGPEGSWEPALEVAGPQGRLCLASAPPDIPREPVPPVKARLVGDSTVFDFGRVLTGVVEFRVTGAGPGEVRVKYGETADAEGHAVCDNAYASGEAQVDQVVVRGPVDLTWRPEFTYKGFRHAELTLTGNVAVSGVRAVPYVAEIARAGSFECDQPLLQWIDTATCATVLNCVHGLPVDTPTYEKNGWTDVHLVAEAALLSLDLRPLLTKWLDDYVDAQDAVGAVPVIVPTPGWGRWLDPAWSGSMVLIPYALYFEHGDTGIIGRYLDPMRRYLDHVLELASETGWLWARLSHGDWLPPGGALEGPTPVATMMLTLLADRLAQMCAAVGLDGVAAGYRSARQAVMGAYHKRYFDDASGTYRIAGAPYRQVMNALPLVFGTVPLKERARVASGLATDVEQRTQGHLNCGSIGVKYLLPALSESGRFDLALTIATQQTRPSWAPWAKTGDGTLWESFDADARSRSHFFLGSVSSWIRQAVGGLRGTAPGWRQACLSPPDDARVTRAKTTHVTGHGLIEFAWERTAAEWRVRASIPPGTEAVLALPSASAEALAPGTHSIKTPLGREAKVWNGPRRRDPAPPAAAAPWIIEP
jgi:alpha-L-rhamnosidase